MKTTLGDIHNLISSAQTSVRHRCLHFDRIGEQCKDDAIQSHSLQRRGPLASIAENGHVMKVGGMLNVRTIESRSNFERQGLAKASTFPGFCNNHDSILFGEVENADIDFTAKFCLTLAIRALAIEVYKKRVMVSLQHQMMDLLLKQGKIENREIALQLKRGAEAAVIENIKKLRALFASYHKNQPPNLLKLAFKFEQESMFACTGAFEPDWDLHSNFLYRVDPKKTEWNTVSLFCGNIRGAFYVVFCGFQKYHNHRLDMFLKSIDHNASHLASLIFTASLAYTENIFVRQSWLECLSEAERSKVINLSRVGVLEGIRDPYALANLVKIPDIPLQQVIR
jgi:hypothetical protein